MEGLTALVSTARVLDTRTSPPAGLGCLKKKEESCGQDAEGGIELSCLSAKIPLGRPFVAWCFA